MHPFISVIIPVYNTENYLRKCLDSVLAQSFADFEVLLINDGSTDGSGKICDEYAKKDKRIKVFHKENGGVSSARNLGLDNAKGEWISFVDSDDTVKENYLLNLTLNIEFEIDLIIGGFIKTDENGNLIKGELKLENTTFSKNNKDVLINHTLFNIGFPVAKLFKRELIATNYISFPLEVKMYEDSLFLMDYLYFCSNIKLVNTQDYNYVEVKGSQSFKIHDFTSEYNAAYLLYKQATDKYGLSLDDLKGDYYELGKRVSTSMIRSIISLFINDYSKNKSINYLNTINDDCLNLYNYYYHPTNPVKKLIKYLAVKKKFKLLVYFGQIIYKIIK